MKLIKNGQVYAPNFLGKKDILLAGEKILKIADHIEAVADYGVEVIDATDRYVIPGLIDSHVHILGGGGEGSYKSRTPEILLSQITKGGVTTVVGCIGTDGTTRDMKSLLAKARGLEEEGVTTFVYTGSYQVPVKTLTGSIMEDLILIDKIIGAGEIAISDHRSSQPTLEELTKIVAESRVGGILSGKAGIVNIHLGDGIKKFQYLIEILKNTEIPAHNMLPTHTNRSKAVMDAAIEYGLLGGIIDLTTSSDPDFLEDDEVKASTGLKMAMDAGIPNSNILFSSDGQGSMPVFNKERKLVGIGIGEVSTLYREIKDAHLIDGVSFEDAIRVGTENVARVLKLKRKGQVKEGFDADLVIIDQDTFEIETVLAKGQVMIRDKEVMVKGTFE